MNTGATTIEPARSRVVAPLLQPYITLHEPAGTTYDYKVRGVRGAPRLRHTLHRSKHGRESIIYMALPADADRSNLASSDLLYVGSQKNSDRMFRGDGLNGQNFHHDSMRKGNGPANLEHHVAHLGPVTIYAGVGTRMFLKLADHPLFAPLEALNAAIVEGAKAHRRQATGEGYALEQYILFHERPLWAWNSNPADPLPTRILRAMEAP